VAERGGPASGSIRDLGGDKLLLLAHLGCTTGAVRISQKLVLKRPLDYRLVLLMAILPDVIDRLLYVFVIPEAESGRLFAHTLLFNLVLLAILVAIRRDLWIYGVLPLGHLLLDLECPSAHQLFWPFLGADLHNIHISTCLAETAGQSYADRIGDRIGNVLVTYGEAGFRSLLIDAAGLAVLVILTVRSRLYEPRRLARLIATGRI
jgi:hypothetical protein